MNGLDVRTLRVSFHGRAADELTRQSLSPRRFRASLAGRRQEGLVKNDGHFVFVNLPASPPPYDIELSGPDFQSRTLTATLPAGPPLELQGAGEDELYVLVSGINVPQSRVSFSTIGFVPLIRAGADVLGPGALSTTLAQDLEGSGVQDAVLQSVAGLAVGDPLRIVRSRRLVLRPGPYYPFPEATTVAAFRVVENTTDEPPLPGAVIQVTAVNAAAVSPVAAGGLTLFRANLAAPLMLGPSVAREARTNHRGDAVFYFPDSTPVTSLTATVTLAGYVSQTVNIAVQATERRFLAVHLDRV